MNKKFLILLSTLLLTGCTNYKSDIIPSYYLGSFNIDNEYVGPLNTICSLKMFNDAQLKETFTVTQDELTRLHKLVDSHNDYQGINNISYINNHFDKWIDVDPSLIDILEKGIDITKSSKGMFSIFLGRLTSEYDEIFSSSNIYQSDIDLETIEDILNNLPDEYEMDNVLEINDNRIKINSFDKDFQIDLGGLSKGYVLDCLSELVYYPAVINLGNSSVTTLKKNPLKDFYLISLREPKESNYSYLFSFKMHQDESISTSGTYEKYYINEDGIRRNHIINPTTGYSTNYLVQATIVSHIEAVYLDSLSTIILNMDNLEDIKKIISEFEIIYSSKIDYSLVLNNDSAYEVYLNEGFKERIQNQNKNLVININDMPV